jgi:hypothetical protein
MTGTCHAKVPPDLAECGDRRSSTPRRRCLCGRQRLGFTDSRDGPTGLRGGRRCRARRAPRPCVSAAAAADDGSADHDSYTDADHVAVDLADHVAAEEPAAELDADSHPDAEPDSSAAG